MIRDLALLVLDIVRAGREEALARARARAEARLRAKFPRCPHCPAGVVPPCSECKP